MYLKKNKETKKITLRITLIIIKEGIHSRGWDEVVTEVSSKRETENRNQKTSNLCNDPYMYKTINKRITRDSKDLYTKPQTVINFFYGDGNNKVYQEVK